MESQRCQGNPHVGENIMQEKDSKMQSKKDQPLLRSMVTINHRRIQKYKIC